MANAILKVAAKGANVFSKNVSCIWTGTTFQWTDAYTKQHGIEKMKKMTTQSTQKHEVGQEHADKIASKRHGPGYQLWPERQRHQVEMCSSTSCSKGSLRQSRREASSRSMLEKRGKTMAYSTGGTSSMDHSSIRTHIFGCFPTLHRGKS
jgi:hypothetical protein